MAIRKRALSAAAASECENAKLPACKCRCGGSMHGAARGKLGALPLNDPHSPSVECVKCGGTGKRMVPDYSVTMAEGEWDYPLIKKDCPYCKGQGRFIKPKVLREMVALGEMPATSEPPF